MLSVLPGNEPAYLFQIVRKGVFFNNQVIAVGSHLKNVIFVRNHAGNFFFEV